VKLALGASRRVLLVGGWAIKFARGRVGRRCNREEVRLWSAYQRHPTRGPHLCHVLWCSASGSALIMRRACPAPDTFREAEAALGDWWDYHPAEGEPFPSECKRDDWGLLEGRLVLVDYAAHTL
jgi:hypothetical protein